MPPAITIEDLSFTYPKQNHPALRNLSGSIDQGRWTVLMGREGAGKSTLCFALNGLIPHFFRGNYQGRVRIGGRDPARTKVSEMARRVGLVLQDFEAQLFSTSVELEMVFGLENIGLPRGEMEARIQKYLKWVGLEKMRQREPASLSGGEKQRLAIGSVLAMEPDFLVLDEPTSDLDPAGRQAIYEIIDHWRNLGKTLILVEQDPETREGYPEARMKVKWPNTYGYLLNFKDELLSRGSRPIRELAERTVFYSMYGIGSYTFAPYKVVWKRMASDMVATVLTFLDTPFGKKPAIPTDTTSLIACNTSEEAHFLCALLNSAPARTYISSFSSAGRGFGAPSIITHMSLPGFDSTNTAHRRLAALSAKAHQLAAQGEGGEAELRRVETEIDRLAAQLWGITTKELAEIHQALAQPAKFAHI